MQNKTFPIILKEAFILSPHVKHFIFQCPEEIEFAYLPGQFITMHFEHQGKMLRRSYSIANAPLKNNRIEFAAGFVEKGPGSALLFHLNPGDALNITGPFGRLVLKESPPKRYILVATSTGITPYRAMLPRLEQYLQETPLQLVIVQGVQKRSDILYGEEFLALSTRCPQAQFHACLSRESKDDLKPHESAGYVQHIFPNLQLNPEQDLIYLCGNPGMIDEAFAYLKEHGFTTQHIVREKYISN